jgi:ankyrin repeat protein
MQTCLGSVEELLLNNAHLWAPLMQHTHTKHQVKEALTSGLLDVNETDSKGDTLLHLAARYGLYASLVVVSDELQRCNC